MEVPLAGDQEWRPGKDRLLHYSAEQRDLIQLMPEIPAS